MRTERVSSALPLVVTLVTMGCNASPTERPTAEVVASAPGRAAPSLQFVSMDDYVAIDLGVLPGGTFSRAQSINSSGQVVGYGDADGGRYIRPFIWQNGVMTDLIPRLHGINGRAHDINDFGLVAGELNGHAGLFFDDHHVSKDIGDALAVSNATSDWQTVEFVGWAGRDAWRWTARDAFSLAPCHRAHDINRSGQIVVSCRTPFAQIWDDGVLTSLSPLIEAYAINDSGQVAGTGVIAPSRERHALLWSNGVATDLGALGYYGSTAYGINNVGQVVGSTFVGNAKDEHAFVWSDGVMTDLGGSASVAVAINDAGVIVGTDRSDEVNSRATLWRKRTPAERVAQLDSAVSVLLDAGVLGPGEANSLGAKLDAAAQQLSDGRPGPAANQLGAFVNQVTALMNSGRLSAELGQQLVDVARKAIAEIG